MSSNRELRNQLIAILDCTFFLKSFFMMWLHSFIFPFFREEIASRLLTKTSNILRGIYQYTLYLYHLTTLFYLDAINEYFEHPEQYKSERSSSVRRTSRSKIESLFKKYRFLYSILNFESFILFLGANAEQIDPDGYIKLLEDLQVSPEDIYTTIAIQWKFKSSPLGTFTSQQFINGCQELGYEPFIIFGALSLVVLMTFPHSSKRFEI